MTDEPTQPLSRTDEAGYLRALQAIIDTTPAIPAPPETARHQLPPELSRALMAMFPAEEAAWLSR